MFGYRARYHCARALVTAVLMLSATSSVAAQQFVIPNGAEWRYHAKPGAPDATWMEPTFDDSAWPVGKAGFGYGDDDDTTVLSSMRNRYTDVLIRREFEITALPENLYLYISYDDAFVAYLNGSAVALGSIDSKGKVGSHEARRTEVFKLSASNIVRGSNVLAIRGLNVEPDSSDFSLHPALATELVDSRNLSRDAARSMLDSLRRRLLDQSSYLTLTGRDPVAALDAFSEDLPESISRLGLLAAVQQIVALVGDGHARVSADFEYDGARYLPFSLAEADVGIIAVDTDNNAFEEREYPLLTSIDGIEIERWIATAARYVSRASPQLNRRRALRSVQRLDLLRQDLELPQESHATLVFANSAGETQTKRVSLSDDRPRTARVAIGESRVLDNNIGYLVIPKMEDERIPELRRWMKKFRKTDGLIIDVRGNGGGRYGIMRALAPHFVTPKSGPVVMNIAKYRLSPLFNEDQLASRPTFRQDDKKWSKQEREVIAEALESFQPKWEPPPDQFSEWHFMLLNRKADRHRLTYSYVNPVVVLSNTECFSATDGFLSAFSTFPNVTLMGQPSSGGSGRARSFMLHEDGLQSRNNAIRVSLSSMASFRSNGELFDGVGVAVDIEVEPSMEDFVDGTDKVLKHALEYLSVEAETNI